MARTQTMVQLSEQLIEQLDAEASARGCSRSALIREAVEAHLRSSTEEQKLHDYVKGYRLQPQTESEGLPDDIAHREMAKALDREEEDAGFSW
jgi:metal-responsive CopG/Arc/MetJ family transcriptional regulator